MLTPYRGWPMPNEGSRLGRWVEALENDPRVKGTTSTDDLYMDSYERYAGMFLDALDSDLTRLLLPFTTFTRLGQ